MEGNRRKYLVDSFHETVHQLEVAYSLQQKGRSVSELLIQSISMHADEKTLQAIQADLRSEMEYAGAIVSSVGSPARHVVTAVETRPRRAENSRAN